MIGRIDVPGKGTAVMGDDGQWIAQSEIWTWILNRDFSLGTGLSVLPFGVGAVLAAAEHYGVVPIWGKKPEPLPPDPDAVS